ncbi:MULTISPECIES: hypothetical protein [unclassified Phaeobacter]|uniref:hypothetical protein n=1 Tax=unclassified Phaeobacter TaxID=2621772 RepID=UPI003A8868C6
MMKRISAAAIATSFFFGSAMAQDITKYNIVEDLSILELEANLSRDRNDRKFDPDIFTDTVRDLYLRVAYAVYAADVNRSIECSEVWRNEVTLTGATAKESGATKEDALKYSRAIDNYEISLDIVDRINDKFTSFSEKYNPTIDLLISYTVLYVNNHEYYEGFISEFQNVRLKLYRDYKSGLGRISAEVASSDCKGDIRAQTKLYQTYRYERKKFFELLFRTLKTG